MLIFFKRLKQFGPRRLFLCQETAGKIIPARTVMMNHDSDDFPQRHRPEVTPAGRHQQGAFHGLN
jgi:hypothetical protein